MTWTLCCTCLSSRPVPLPVTSAGVLPVITAQMALLAVVLPMPISPVPTMSSPFVISDLTISIPVSIALRACAGSSPDLHPYPGCRARSCGIPGAGVFGGHAYVNYNHPCAYLAADHVDARAAMQEVQHHLGRHFLGVSAGPPATTPWSPAITITAFRLICGIGLPWMPAIWMDSSSNLPRLPVGLVRVSCLSFACDIAFWSSGFTF